MKKHFTAAIYGTNTMTKALRSTFASRFGNIVAFVMLPSKSIKLSLHAYHDARSGSDMVVLRTRNWSTGDESILYRGPVEGGVKLKGRTLKD